MPLSLLNHSALALFAQRTRIPTSARSIGFCAIWVCISSSSSYLASSLRTSRRGLSAQCVSRPRYTRHFSGLFFALVGHRFNVLVRRRAPAALSIACPLSCCICSKDWSSDVCSSDLQVHKAFLRAIFRPSRAPAQCSCQAAGASRSQHRLSSFLLHMANYGSRSYTIL